MSVAKARRLALAIAAILGLLLLLRHVPLGAYLERFAETIRGAGPPGVALFVIVYVLAGVLMLPASILTLLAGFVYGPFRGLCLVSPASVTAATASFFLGRSVARGWIASRMERHPRFAALDRAASRQGFRIVFLLRLSPIFPFNVLNYALGLTGVRPLTYIVASFLGMLPATFLYVYLGSLITSATELAEGRRPKVESAEQATYWIGLAATVIVTVILARIARGALREAVPEASEANPRCE